jgi:hypothetical protein
MPDDRADFIYADEYPVTLADGITVDVQDDPDGYLSAGDDEPDDTQYVYVVVEDPATGAFDSLGGIGIPAHLSGYDACRVIWDVIGPDCCGLIDDVRRDRDREVAERAHWAARDVVTVS